MQNLNIPSSFCLLFHSLQNPEIFDLFSFLIGKKSKCLVWSQTLEFININVILETLFINSHTNNNTNSNNKI